MEEIIEVTLKFLIKLFLWIFRGILFIIWDVACEKFLWYLGWPVVRMLTLGAYPKEKISQVESSSVIMLISVAFVGLVCPFLVTYLLVNLE